MRRVFVTIGLISVLAVAASCADMVVAGVASSAQAAHASESRSAIVLAGSAPASKALDRRGGRSVAAPARATPGPLVESFALDEGTVLSAGGKVLLSIITAGASRCVISASPAIKGLRSVVSCRRGMTFLSSKVPPNHRHAALRYRISVRATRRGASSPVVTRRLVELGKSRSSASAGAAQGASPFASPGDFEKFALDKALRYAAGKVGIPGDALGFLLQKVGLEEAKPDAFAPVRASLDQLAGGIDALQKSLNAFQVAVNDAEFTDWSALNQGFETNLDVMKQYLENIAAYVTADPTNSAPATRKGIADNVTAFLKQYQQHALEFQGDIDRFASWLGVASQTFGPKYAALDLFARYELHGRRYATSRDSDQIRLFAGYVENLQALALSINEIALGQPPDSCGTDTTKAECGNQNTAQAIRIANEYVRDVSRENARLPLPIPQNAVVDLQGGTTTTDKLMWLPALGGRAFSIHLLTWWLPVDAGVTLPTYPQFPTPRKAGVLPTYTYLQYDATGAPSGNQTNNTTDPPTDYEAIQAGFKNWVVASRDQIRNFAGHSAVNYNPTTSLGSYLTGVDPGSSWDHLAARLLTSTTINYTVSVTNSICPSGFEVTTPGFFDLAAAENIDTNFHHLAAPLKIETNNAVVCQTKYITSTGWLPYDFDNYSGSVLLVRKVDPDHAMGVDYLGHRVDASPGAGENVYSRADLEGANLSGLDLSGPLNPQTNTAGTSINGDPAFFANFTATNLTRAYLGGDNLSGQNFTDANLTDANLKSVDLSNTNLGRATLQGVSSGGILVQPGADAPTLPSGWVLTDGYLAGPHANLAGANLAGANLAGADLAGADLIDANLAGANLAGANLTGANLVAVRSGGISGTPSRLPDNWMLTANGYLVGPRAKLEGANLKDQVLNGRDLAGVIFKDANLEGAQLTGATISGANFLGARLDGVQSGGLIGVPSSRPFISYGSVRVDLQDLPANWKLIKGYLVGPSADLNGANLDGADFTNAHVNPFLLEPLSLAGAHLVNAHLVGANLAGVNLKGTDLSGVYLTSANLTDADLSGARNLASAHIDATTIWANTTCPDGTNSNARGKTCVGH